MILTVTLNPAIDKTASVEELVVGGLNRLDHVLMNAGGKGINVSKTIQALGGVSTACGFVGGNNGRYITNCLDELAITHAMVWVEGETRVNLKVLNQDMELTELNESGPMIREAYVDELCEKIQTLLRQDDILVLSGSAPKGVNKNIYETLTRLAKSKGASVLLDADGELFELGIKAIPDVIKPNKYELCKYFKVDESISMKELIVLARGLIDKGIGLIVISMGKEGSIYLNKDGCMSSGALEIEANSSVGAGDAMVAALALALERKFAMEDMIRLAVASSAGAVCTQGTAPADLKTVNALSKQVVIDLMEE